MNKPVKRMNEKASLPTDGRQARNANSSLSKHEILLTRGKNTLTTVIRELQCYTVDQKYAQTINVSCCGSGIVFSTSSSVSGHFPEQ